MSFALIFLLFAAAAQIGLFAILFLTVSAHEAAHVLTAKLFGLNVESIDITPMGQAARIPGLNGTPPLKRLVIILSGPFLNIIIAVICMIFSFQTAAAINWAIALWNLLPSPPLDGGRLLLLVLDFFFGFSLANKICRVISMIISVLLICAGFARTILFPYDISLLFAAFYLFKLSKKELCMAAFDFYKYIFSGEEKYKRPMGVKNLFIPPSMPLKKALDKLCYDRVIVYHIFTDNGILNISEKQLINYACENGPAGTIGEIYDF